ncbi:hypothetical protein BU23DRAFT_571942 [Bimuria novae-zelandiae CBS 107.79]|uniref:Protein kinase domain-containing protein n=1 Tax=Bimuria novae-zelandiae CBS 107.79 TaxID=1447943 RepID=A0A6A5UYY6_9PLEO|nr:hypothetical protein BU23DRAFT_571942 [Bimuria novae-zelandiae CBS 107.79]
MVFEYAAGGDMKTWITQSSQLVFLTTELAHRKFILHTLESIASSLAYIHSKIDREKICDFRRARLKSVKDGSKTQVNGRGTYRYTPPEYFFQSDAKHGRKWDVWSMGNSDISRNNGYGSEEDCSFHNNSEAAFKWIRKLEQEDSQVTQLSNLARDMLEMNPDRRIFAWEVEIELHELLNPGISGPELTEFIMQVIQEPRLPQRKDCHNVLARAKAQGRKEMEECLVKKKWVDCAPALRQCSDRSLHQNVPKHFSSLPGTFEKRKLFRRSQLLARVRDILAKLQIVEIHGMGGFGQQISPSIHYAAKLQDSKNFHVERRRKLSTRTFWVDAGNMWSVEKSNCNIGGAINMSPIPQELKDLAAAVKDWLNNPSNGPWPMVSDGLDSVEVARDCIKVLPSRESGPLIITTRDRGILADQFELQRASCVPVKTLELSDSRDMFTSRTGHTTEEDADIDALLQALPVPYMIEVMAHNIRIYQTPISTILKFCRRNPLAILQDLHGNGDREGKDDIVQMLPRGFFRSQDDSSGNKLARKSLFTLLICFSKDNIDEDLHEERYPLDERVKMQIYLGILKNHSFIQRDQAGSVLMHEITKTCLVARVETSGPFELFTLSDEALCMIYNTYQDDNNRYDDAIEFLKFAHIHALTEESQKETAELLRELAEVCENRPSGRETGHYRDNALHYAKLGLELASNARIRSVEWRLILDMSRVHTDLGKYSEARSLLKDLKAVDVRVNGTDEERKLAIRAFTQEAQQERQVLQERVWVQDRNLAAVLMRTGSIEDAVKEFELLVQRYENAFERNNSETRECAYLLRDAYVLAGRGPEADGLCGTFNPKLKKWMLTVHPLGFWYNKDHYKLI